MMRNLAGRLEKLEKGTDGGEVKPFYLLWVTPGSDRKAALAELRSSGRLTPDVSVYCAEWKTPECYSRRNQKLGSQPRSRLTTHDRLSDDEAAVLFDAICDDAQTRLMAGEPKDRLYSGLDEVDRGRVAKMTDRELMGAIICSSALSSR